MEYMTIAIEIRLSVSQLMDIRGHNANLCFDSGNSNLIQAKLLMNIDIDHYTTGVGTA